MLTITKAGLQRGIRWLFRDAELVIQGGERWGVIGHNGCGKSSLFEVVNTGLHLDEGDFSLAKGVRISYMTQEVGLDPRSALEFVVDGHAEYRELERQLSVAEAAKNNHAIATIHARFDDIAAYKIKADAGSILYGLGFSGDEHEKPVASFSGGWRVRLNLAKALLCPSDLLLLDEPSNHLDLEAIFWLERWLKKYPGTLLLISHDRLFLDKTVDHIVHIDQGTFISYKGNYSSFERQRAIKLSQQQATHEKQQKRVSEIQAFVARFRAKASKAKQAQSRLKSLERMELVASVQLDSEFKFSFKECGRMSDPMLKLSDTTVGYDEKPILSNIEVNIRPGSRVGVLGINGAGKSTLLKAISGELALQMGERILGNNINIVYFAQDLINNLNFQQSAYWHVQQLSRTAREQEIRNFLGGFAFQGNRADEPVETFSGGEKSRLVLALCVWRAPNLLILDEPTNHLDMKTREALVYALNTYQGAMLLVSHDQYLLENSVDDLWLVKNGSVTDYKGTVEDYAASLESSDGNSKGKRQNSGNKSRDNKARRQEAAKQRQNMSNALSKAKKVEAQLEQLNKKLQVVESHLTDATIYDAENKDQLQQLLQEQASLKKNNQTLETQWLEINDELERQKQVPAD